MDNIVLNTQNSERSVEIPFIAESLKKYYNGGVVLDVGGVPTSHNHYKQIYETINNLNVDYRIADFRGGQYQGDFVTFDFTEKFDTVMFVSSLEHFPQCTEGDLVFRDKEDVKGFKKALSILKDDGLIFLTVPFGKPVWQQFHQNYDMDLIKELSEDSHILEQYTYTLKDTNWILTDPAEMSEIRYTDKCYGVGCFVFRKD